MVAVFGNPAVDRNTDEPYPGKPEEWRKREQREQPNRQLPKGIEAPVQIAMASIIKVGGVVQIFP